MQISSQYPVLFRSGNTQPSVKNDAFKEPSTLPVRSTGFSQVSSMQTFQDAAASHSARFHKIHDLDAHTQAALQAYKNTEALASNNPRHALIGVDVFA